MLELLVFRSFALLGIFVRAGGKRSVLGLGLYGYRVKCCVCSLVLHACSIPAVGALSFGREVEMMFRYVCFLCFDSVFTGCAVKTIILKSVMCECKFVFRLYQGCRVSYCKPVGLGSFSLGECSIRGRCSGGMVVRRGCRGLSLVSVGGRVSSCFVQECSKDVIRRSILGTCERGRMSACSSFVEECLLSPSGGAIIIVTRIFYSTPRMGRGILCGSCCS